MAKKVQFTTNQPSASTDYLAADNTWKTMSGGGGGGTVTSVALTTPAAFSVSGSPITTSGTLAISGAGTASQYVKGDGTLGTTATSLPPNGSAGGDLNGTYPNPTVDGIHGIDMQSGTPSADEVWVYGGSPAKWQHQKLHASQTTNDSTVSGTNVDDALDTLKTTKQDTITGAATTITTTDLTGSRVLVSNPGGKIAVSAVTTTEVGYLVGVTSDIQTQLNAKQGTLTLTTTGTSGAATLGSGILNIPQYAGAGSGVSFIGGTIGNGTGVVPGLSTQYVGLAGASNVNAETTREMILPQDCTLSRMYFRIGNNQPSTGSLVLTLRKNGADTALTITVASGSAGGAVFSNIVNSISYSAGDVAAIKFVNNAGANSARLELISIMVTI